MLYLIELAKFDLDKDSFCQKLASRLSCSVTPDFLSSRLRVEGNCSVADFFSFSEVSRVFLVEVVESPLELSFFRSAVVDVAKKYTSFQLQVKAYPGVGIPASAFKKKLAGPFITAGVSIVEEASVVLLLEIYKESGRLFYRLLTSSVAQKLPSSSSSLTIVLEEPHLAEELADFLRLCYIFSLRLIVVHKDHAAASTLIGQAKKLCKGRLSTFDVRVVRHLRSVEGLLVGFSRHARDGESSCSSFLRSHRKEPLVLVFGNDLYGLSQQSREALYVCFSLTASPQKPLKGNQALAYVLGMITVLR